MVNVCVCVCVCVCLFVGKPRLRKAVNTVTDVARLYDFATAILRI